MSVQIRGVAGNVAAVSANSQLQTNLPLTASQAGFAMVGCEVDAGTLTGTRRVVEVDASRDFRMRVGLDSLLFDEKFSGATLNASKWQAPVTTQTVTVGGGVATLNGSNITTINTVSRIVSYKTFPVRTSFPTYVEIRAGVFGGSLGIPNTQLEWGIGNVTGTTVVATDGARFYWDAAGAFLAEVTYNGAPINADITAMVAGAGVTENAFQSYLIVIDVGDVYFYIGNQMAARISTPNGAPFPFSSAALPVYARALNAAVAPATASQVRVATFTVSQGDMNNARPWSDVMSLQGDNAIQQPTGTASAQTANYANSAVPATATLSNTAAGYTTLGGQFVFAAPAGAETDYALFGFQVPALAAFGKAPNMVLRGVRISAINVGATVATTATVVQWGVGIGSTAVSLATVDAATTRAPRRLTLGYHTFAVGAGIGASGGADLWHQFLAPQPVESGTFIHIICKIPVGTATASQQIRGTVAVDAHWE